jgi:predicted O-methyltransferase YrrM
VRACVIGRLSDGGDGLSLDEIKTSLSQKGLSDNVILVPGDVRETLPNYLSDNTESRIALLHLDMDVYEPTLFALEALWDRMCPGALVVIDDYNAVAGATAAVDEFFKGRAKIEKLPMAHVPSFICKA